jgi:Fe2+ transport system protein FeoA
MRQGEAMKMSELKPGDKATVVSVDPSGETGMRLIEMGVVKGANFKFVRKAPLGDPVEIKLRGFILALRKEEASRVEVEVTGHVGDGKPMGKKYGFMRRKGCGHEK